MGAIAIVDAAVFYGAQRILDGVKDERFRLNDDLLSLWASLRKTVVFVTHSVFESVYLSRGRRAADPAAVPQGAGRRARGGAIVAAPQSSACGAGRPSARGAGGRGRRPSPAPHPTALPGMNSRGRPLDCARGGRGHPGGRANADR